jgi:hypothetical protein
MIPATARTRRGKKALKAVAPCFVSLSGGARSGGQRQEGMGPERGTDRDEEKPLKGEAQGRSDTQVSGGPVVEIAQGVAKPRTRYAAAEGSVVDYGSAGLRTCRRVREVQERKCRLTSRGYLARRHGVPVMCSEEERKFMEGRPST